MTLVRVGALDRSTLTLFRDPRSHALVVGGLDGRSVRRDSRDYEEPAPEYLAFHRDQIFERAAWSR